MDWIAWKEKIPEQLKKYRYAALVLLIGILLMMLPQHTAPSQETTTVQPEVSCDTLQDSLSQILSKMDGAGKVQVLLTESESQRILYQSDENRSQSGDSNDLRRETVIITGSDREENGLVQQTQSPVYLGAIVLCQGADSPSVRLALVEAVANATGLSTDKISVLKMK